MFNPLLSGFKQHWKASGYSNTTLEGYLQVYAHLQRLDYPLPPDLTLADAQQFVLHRLKTVKPSTVAFEVKAMKALSKWVAGFLSTEDHLRGMRIPKFDEPIAQPTATPEDLAKLVMACRNSIGFESVRDEALILFFWCTGARRSEVARMKIKDIDLDQGVAYLMATKARKPRQVSIEAMTPQMTRYLVERGRHKFRESDALWIGQDGALGAQGIGFAHKRREDQAGVSIGTHGHRRALTVNWLGAGGSETGLTEIAGWTSTAMIRRYAKSALASIAIEEQRRLFPADGYEPGARAKQFPSMARKRRGRPPQR